MGNEFVSNMVLLFKSSTVWKYTFIFMASMVFLHGLLCAVFGISIGWINPFLMKISHIGISTKKVDIQIGSIRLNLSVSSWATVVLVLEGVNITIKSVPQNAAKYESETEEMLRKPLQDLSNFETDIPLCVFPESPLVKHLFKLYLLYFRFVGLKIFDLNVTGDDIDIALNSDSLLAKVSMKQNDNNYAFNLNVRLFQQSINDIEILDTLLFNLSGSIDMENGNLSMLKISSELRDMNLPLITLSRIIQKLKERSREKTPKRKIVRDEDYFFYKFQKRLIAIRYFVNFIEEFDFSLHGFSVEQIPLANANIVHCHRYKPTVLFKLRIASFVASTKRMYFDTPGYGLSFDFNDRPYRLIFNFTGVSLTLDNLSTGTSKEVISVPVMNFTGSSNYAFQTLKAARTNGESNSKVIFVGHLSEPVVDLSTDDIATAAMSFLQYMKHQEQLRLSNMLPIKDEDDLKANAIHWNLIKKHRHLLPILDLKFGIENPIFLMKSTFDDQYYRILVFKLSLLALEFKTIKDELDDQSVYSSDYKVNLHSLKAKYINNSSYLEEDTFNIEDIAFKLTQEIIPESHVQSSLEIAHLKLDASNLRVLHGLNHLFNELQSKVSPLFEDFRTESGEFGWRYDTVPVSVDQEIPIEEPEPFTLAQFVDGVLPDWLRSLKISITKSTLILGSRSLLISKELMKGLDPHTKNDLVGGQLRKFELAVDKVEALFLLGREGEDIDSSSSSLEDDDRGLSDSGSESTLILGKWKLIANVTKVVGKVISEKSSKREILKEKVFLKINNVAVSAAPHESEERILLNWNIDKIDLLYSVMTHFLLISTVHLIRNTIFEFLLKMKQKSEKPQLRAKKRKPSPIKHLLDFVDLKLKIDFFDWIMVMPDRLKLRLELTEIGCTGTKTDELYLDAHYIRLCAESPTSPGYWARLITAVNGSTIINIPSIISKSEDPWFLLANDTCNLSVPNRFVIYKIFENVSVTFKTLKQLHHSLKFNTNEFIINPSIKPAVKIPPINLKSGRFIFSMDDDPFEAELNMIFQVGLIEQKMRYEKTKLFEKQLVEEFEKSHKIKNRSTTSDNPKEKENHLKIIDDLNSFIPITRRTGIFRNKQHGGPQSAGLPSSASATLPTQHGKPSDSEQHNSPQQIQKRLHALREGFSKSWITRVKNYKDKMKMELYSSFEFLRGNLDFTKLSPEFNKRVLEYSKFPSLLTLILENLDLDLGPPKFGIDNVPDFLYDIGKGVPKDTKYSILIPLHADLKLKELRAHLRDYPLPLVYMPAVSKPQHQNIPGVRLHGDIVIAEAAIRSRKEVREVFVPLVPGCEQFDEDDCYSLEVPKTLTAIKTFTQLDWELNSIANTRVTWGTSYQPCIGLIMQSLDNFTKPPIDPSRKVGFWDKIRIMFHARWRFQWNHGGHLNIQFKGSKDPYSICGESAGFALSFEDEVILSINEKDDPSKFFVVDSNTITFAVPNHLASPILVWSRVTSDAVLLGDPSTNFEKSAFGYYIGNHEKPDIEKIQAMQANLFEKSVITLSGGVQFIFGVSFERKSGPGQRSSEFKPHYDMVLCNPKYVKDRENFDSYAGFRSDFVHLAFSLISEKDGAYNKIQLSPNSFTYFFSWWKMFSNTLSVRNGPIFGPTRESTKFSRHLYTIKYQAVLEPLFISDVYRDTEFVYDKFKTVDCVGLKGKVSKFVMDLHQRKELTFDHNENLGVTKRLLKTKFNVGKIVIDELDLRAVHGKFINDMSTVEQPRPFGDDKKDHYKFTGFDNDESWFDITDFIEIGSPLFGNYMGDIEAYPLMSTPKFVYSKHNSYGDNYQLDFETSKRIKPFGDESFHSCLIDKESLAITQCTELEKRLEELNNKLDRNQKEIAKLDAQAANYEVKSRIGQLKVDNEQIRHGATFVSDLLRAYQQGSSQGISGKTSFEFAINDIAEGETFTNRFTVHNMLLKWNDTNRNIVYKFIYLFENSTTTKKFLQYKSLAQLDELIENQRLANIGSGLSRPLTRATTLDTTLSKPNEAESEEIKSHTSGRIQNFKEELRQIMVGFFYRTHDTYYVKLISPQIQLQSEEDAKSCVLVAAPDIELNIISFDSNETDEEYNENVFEQRFGAILTNASIFMFAEEELIGTGKQFFRESSYGSNEAWPPWLGVELCYDGSLISDHMLMNKTSLVLRYDKSVPSAFIPTDEHTVNKLTCDLSQAVITCDSKQYYSLYNIATKLLIYNEPREAEHKARESKVMFSLDMSDLASIRNRITQLQEAVRQSNHILQNLTWRRPILDDLQIDDMHILAMAKYEASEELHLLMHASLSGGAGLTEKSDDFLEWYIRADDIKLHLLDENRDPFVDVILFNSHFKRVEHSDRSDRNQISIQNLEIINLNKHSQFPVIFSGAQLNGKSNSKKKNRNKSEHITPMIQISWNMGHPVGGIRVMKKFEVDLLPVQLSFEESTGEKIMEFVFPGETPSDELESDTESTISGRSSKKTFDNPVVNGKSTNLHVNSNGKSTNFLANSNGHRIQRPSRTAANNLVIDSTASNEIASRPSTSPSDSRTPQSLRGKRSIFSLGSNEDSLDNILSKHESAAYTAEDDEGSEDGDVDEMIQRASNYLSFVAFCFKSVSICITFRGQGSRRLINVTDFVLNLPDITFTNKTYTLLDVTMQIKKATIKALLSHSGSLIGNKLFKHSDGKGQKQVEGISNYANSRIKSFRG